jgi:hypothetical protein
VGANPSSIDSNFSDECVNNVVVEEIHTGNIQTVVIMVIGASDILGIGGDGAYYIFGVLGDD